MEVGRGVESFFDGYARDFDAIYDGRRFPGQKAIDRVFRKSMLLRFTRTIEGCNPIVGKSVLDVGCGSGHYATILASLGADRVLGIDFAEQMLTIARARGEATGTADRCAFRNVDVFDLEEEETFDYTVVMGVMDYIAEAGALLEKVCRLTRSRAFFSFPVAGGLLAWQRELRYRRRCPLYFYDAGDLERLFERVRPNRASVERLARDFFVTVDIV